MSDSARQNGIKAAKNVFAAHHGTRPRPTQAQKVGLIMAKDCKGHDVCDPSCPIFRANFVPTLQCPAISDCGLWNAERQACSYFCQADEPMDEDCAAAHHLNSRGLLRHVDS